MKRMTYLLLLIGMIGTAQVKGNKQIQTQTFSVKGLTDLEMGLYARVEIDQMAEETMTITTDSNLLNLIDVEVVDGRLKLKQKKWIQPSQDIVIKIGMPNLERILVGVHETVFVKNVNAERISLMALNGKIVASGSVNAVGIGAENGTVDARNLMAKEVVLNIWGDGKAVVNASEVLQSTLSEDARVELIGTPKQFKGQVNKLKSKLAKRPTKEIQWIQFKIKNNSANRNHFVVRGPKADGSKFGYGFPMMANGVRKETWSVGTKIFLKSKLGIKKLLVTIGPQDEGKIVNLFSN